MSLLAFILLALMFAMYVLTDGYDLGTACVTPLIARDERERFASMRSIGPFWNGNEVWLIAGGGVLFALFPQAYASAFSGFYLPFMVVLWLLMFRGIALELRSHFESRIWHDFWDTAFSLSSTLLILLFGVALGNLVRGVPLDADGYFTGTFAFLLNPYALGVGVLAVVTLAQHGLVWVMIRIEGPPAERARQVSVRLWPVLVALYLIITIATFVVRPTVFDRGPGALFLPILTLAILFFLRHSITRARAPHAFLGSCAFIASLLGAAAATMYPYLLLGYPAGSGGLSVDTASPSTVTLVTALSVAVVGLISVVIYTTLVSRSMRGKIEL
ncbi:MAG TPA: cytochrome d ubiquinol oxidase subunit II [Candidatus Baltobacteraceae bacterium]|jgi:cytochrome d ubiquinol oxidase subunit II|nr:cytochrome d ubiquinol oxidase subunit II [Candidatus Baltobacteraceae bacterium]